ncbi:M24 family metallopeptidase [Ponticaulis koreensis]|uniref:M24 family metallopeptidase n=1 Tax=Ponticaulis koreensis TaxID=1123045 RepID=UPI00042550C0|nr:Xaa-Pro peptidase family protein [Ponticaulis koreensis]
MTLSRRRFGQLGLAAGLTGLIAPQFASASDDELPAMAAGAQPISPLEHEARIARAQVLMQEQGIDALVLEAGSALFYFTGIRWWRSERFTGVVIPAEGTPTVVTPYFEEPSVRESVKVDVDVRTWHEHESPFALVAGILSDAGLSEGKVAIEETVRHFISDGIAQAAPSFEMVSGMSVTRGVRMFKSPAELALMQTANNITLAAYRHIYPRVELGMNQFDISNLMSETTRRLGGNVEFSMVLLNEASAYPHGTGSAQEVREGSVILMDCGCGVHDYESDISRTWVFGEPTTKQRQVWNTVKRGQELALETAQIGTPAGQVDATVRAFYEREGYGPGYQTPGLSHRLGHGIGLDGHEPVNFVMGEETPLAPGMCFSNEPGIYIFGEFGVRLEDCLYMTEDGPRLFSEFAPSIEAPFG